MGVKNGLYHKTAELVHMDEFTPFGVRIAHRAHCVRLGESAGADPPTEGGEKTQDFYQAFIKQM
jgi:hypothetical protein